jgi:polyhydroxyalkanoate synthesis regulator phasin
MAAPDNGHRALLEQVLLAGLGAASLTKDRVDDLIDSMAERGGISREDARSAVNDVVARWRGDASRVTERAGTNLQGLLRELGLVLRSEHDELELRVAQLEHRLKLLED